MGKIPMFVIAAAMVTGITMPAEAATIYASLGDQSAFVVDWALGEDYTNYAFKAATGAYVGSWQVDDGPIWITHPIVYSGQSAAALLFGGNAADYVISTIDAVFANADHQAWVSTFGGTGCDGSFPCGSRVAEGFSLGTEVEDETGAVPEPANWAMMLGGFGLMGAAMRRRQHTTISFG